jgi:catechol 2,3-dioxygenase
MAVTGVLRPGFVQLRVLDMDEALAYYRDRIGLDLVGTVAERRAYLRAFDEFDRHSIILREADSAGVDHIGFKVARDEDLDHFRKRIEALGVPVADVPALQDPGVGRRIRFMVPTGHVIDLYADMALSEDAPMTRNPELWHREPRGMRVVRFDHCALSGRDIMGSARIFREALDFSLAEEAVDEESGTRLALFLSCSNKAHDIAFIGYPEDGRLHHASFLLESWHDVGHAADIIARYDISLDIGPTRHGITRGQTIYFFDPSGNRNETFAGGYQFYPDNPLRMWSADQAGKAIFYYQRRVNDTFLTVTS